VLAKGAYRRRYPFSVAFEPIGLGSAQARIFASCPLLFSLDTVTGRLPSNKVRLMPARCRPVYRASVGHRITRPLKKQLLILWGRCLLREMLIPGQVDAVQLLHPLPIPAVKWKIRGDDLA